MGLHLFPRIFPVLLFAFVSCGLALAQGRYEGSYAEGVSRFYAGDYAGAANSFEMAEVDNPGNHAAYLWHGIALAALDDIDRASNVWLAMPYDENYKASFRYLLGLTYWRRGDTSNAKYWLKEGLDQKDTPAYSLSQASLKSLMSDGEVPLLTDWPTIVKLPRARGVGSGQPAPSSAPPASKASAAPPPADAQAQSAAAGVNPTGGLWQGTISNSYKGQTIAFRVSPDGRMISDVTFHGYFIKRGGGIEQTQLAPLNSIAVSGGRFSDTQLNGGAMVRFDFEGVFTGPASAQGTYRVMSDTDCDTYKLQWTASRVGN